MNRRTKREASSVEKGGLSQLTEELDLSQLADHSGDWTCEGGSWEDYCELLSSQAFGSNLLA